MHFFSALIGQLVAGSSLQTDREVLLRLKSFLQDSNRINRGRYTEWNESSSSPCNWPGISCSSNGETVTGVDLSDYSISGHIFDHFCDLTELSELDLSKNTIGGPIPDDLNRCKNLKYLNLSYNILEGELNLTGLNSLETLDLTVNRLYGGIQSNFPSICNRLITLKISENNFNGTISNVFDECSNLQHLYLSSNNFSGQLWLGFSRLREFSVSENQLSGEISPSIFPENCSLEFLDLSGNELYGQIPKGVSNCRGLVSLNLWQNSFTGQIPSEIGLLGNLEGLYLGNNKLSREIPKSLLNCSKLSILDLRNNSFGGDLQEILGSLVQVKFLLLNKNSYTGGIISSGILKLPNVTRLDLSYNNFSGPLLVEFSQALSLKFLILAYNQFSGSIPPEFGNLSLLQALDLSFNRLMGKIPPTIGKLTSLLWVMLANNSLTGEIPPEIGNCSSLLWLNLANNKLSGNIPPELSNIGWNLTPTFESNRQNNQVMAGSGECLMMHRWIPADYSPFSFAYTLFSRKNCRSNWDRLLKGHGLFPICVGASTVQTLQISGYLQLNGNQLSGEIPPEIGKMKNFSLLCLGINNFYGKFPPEIAQLPLIVLDVSYNGFSGEIPSEIGNIKCLQNLDLSYNNFSGEFPISLNNLNNLNKFNISYNPLISGVIPSTGQLATFDKDSFLGDPLLRVPYFINNTGSGESTPSNWTTSEGKTMVMDVDAFMVFFAVGFCCSFCFAFYICFTRSKLEFCNFVLFLEFQ